MSPDLLKGTSLALRWAFQVMQTAHVGDAGRLQKHTSWGGGDANDTFALRCVCHLEVCSFFGVSAKKPCVWETLRLGYILEE